MKYKCYTKKNKEDHKGGDYWRDVDPGEHLKLTDVQTGFQYFLQNFSTDLSVLEAGCGLGRWVIPLMRKGYKVTGIEIEQDAVDIVRRFFGESGNQVVQGDIFNMPFKDASFDVVVSLGVLEHFDQKHLLEGAFKEHLRVMKRDGFMFITVPYFSFVRCLIHVPFKNLVTLVRQIKGKNEVFTEYRYGVRTFKKILRNNGLVVQKVFWDDLTDPFSFGLTTDYPLKKWTSSNDGIHYKLNKTGRYIQQICWRINPGLVSGGVGFVCVKKR